MKLQPVSALLMRSLFSPVLAASAFLLAIGVFTVAEASAQTFPPLNIQATDGEFQNKVVVSWQEPSDGPADSYLVYRFDETTGATVGLGCPSVNAGPGVVISSPVTGLTYDDVPPTANKIYHYAVIAVRGGVPSNCLVRDTGFRSAQLPPAPPFNVSATNTDEAKITVTWQLSPQTPAITKLRLYRATVLPPEGVDFCGSVSPSGITELGASQVSFTDSGATPGVGYYYALKSVRADQESGCSQVAVGLRPLPPSNQDFSMVSATDGTFTDRVDVTWTPPPAGILFAQLVYSDDPAATCGNGTVLTPVNFLGGTPQPYKDTTAIPGRKRYYWLRTPSGDTTNPFLCSNIDPGHRKLSPPTAVSATDGVFGDRVVVTWNPPAGDVTGYDVYRTPDCSGAPIASNIPTTQHSDFAVTPGEVYTYSIRALSSLPDGSSTCSSPDPGHARVGPPAISATKGKFPDKVVVTWTPPTTGGKITGYRLYRDTSPTTPCMVLLKNNLPANGSTYNDTAVTPAVQYYYSIEALSDAGPGVCSPVDLGFTVTQCSDGKDNDGDGLVDLADPGCSSPADDDEKNPGGPAACDDGIDNDGDGKIDFRADGTGDPGCDSPSDQSEDDANAALLSPAFAKFNTFLGQWNFAELINQGTKAKEVRIGVFNLRGELMVERVQVVEAKQQVDVDINNLVFYACSILNNNCEGFEDLSATTGAPNGLNGPDGIVDTYGLVRFIFDDSDPNERLVGRMSFYRPNVDGSFSFAFSREFRNPLTGTGYAGANTYDPRGMGFLVPNWAEVIAFGRRDAEGNLTLEPQSFTMNIYDQEGVKKFTKRFTLPGLGELDIQAGHEFVNAEGKVVESVYLVEVIPDDPAAEYFLSVSRYSSNAPPATDPETYNFALTLEGQNGKKEKLFAPISNTLTGVQGLKSTVYTANWVEVSCVSDVDCVVSVLFRDSAGAEIGRVQQQFKAKSQFHFNASALLPKKDAGTVEIIAHAGSIVSQSMSYVHGDANELQSGFASLARSRGRSSQAGSINTFLSMQNVLTVLSTTGKATEADFSISSFRGGEYTGVLSLGVNESSGLQISNNPALNFPPDTFGALLLNTAEEGSFVAEVRRVRVTADGAVDFVMPTLVK